MEKWWFVFHGLSLIIDGTIRIWLKSIRIIWIFILYRYLFDIVLKINFEIMLLMYNVLYRIENTIIKIYWLAQGISGLKSYVASSPFILCTLQSAQPSESSDFICEWWRRNRSAFISRNCFAAIARVLFAGWEAPSTAGLSLHGGCELQLNMTKIDYRLQIIVCSKRYPNQMIQWQSLSG